MKKYLAKNKYIITIVSLILLFLVLLLSIPLPEFKSPSKTVYASDGTLLKAYLTQDDKWRLETHLKDVTPEFITAIIEKEDKWFYWHLGINPISMVRAAYQNLSTGNRVSGASTITMQVARMIAPAKRNYISKITEIFRAFQLELKYSKDEILELYLRMLPFGGNIEGVKSASYIYFNKPPNLLSLAQAITLTVIPKDPNRLRIDKSVINTIKRRNYWIDNFLNNKIFNQSPLLDAKDESLKAQRYSMPNLSPQFCDFVIRDNIESNSYSTLDYNLQKKTEQLLKSYVKRVKQKQINNGAVLVIDNSTNSVVAYAGSADFNDSLNSGQVNGIESIRSPGSTLKPGLYAAAIDKGLITPRSILLDIPTDFSGYEPENYDLKFRGEVTVESSLQNSLNIPAVSLLNNFGLGNYLSILETAGFKWVTENKNKVGLSIILGGCGVTLFELTRFFNAFANQGNIQELNFLSSSKNENGLQIFSAEAAYIISTLLSKIERPDFPIEFLDDTNLPKFAWKTGTSFGKRDAWAIGFNKSYTIGIWLGNFNGEGSPYLSGAEMAVPLLFDLFNSIDYKNDKSWFEIPQNLGIRQVCSETGMLPSVDCANLVEDYYIENISSNKICDRSTKYYVNMDTSIQYCPECLPKDGHTKISYPKYSHKLLYWFNTNNISYNQPPKHNINCSNRSTSEGPTIISPNPNFEYILEKSGNEKIALQASSQPIVKNHYWYVDDKFYKTALNSEKIFFTPNKNLIKINCMDDLGRSSQVKVKIKFY